MELASSSNQMKTATGSLLCKFVPGQQAQVVQESGVSNLDSGADPEKSKKVRSCPKKWHQRFPTSTSSGQSLGKSICSARRTSWSLAIANLVVLEQAPMSAPVTQDQQ